MAFQNGPAGWNFEPIEGNESQPEYEKKYGPCLKKLSKHVGKAANSADIRAFQFLIHYTELITSHVPGPTTPSLQAETVWAVSRSLATTREIISFPPGT